MKIDLSKYPGETNLYEKKEKLETSKPKSWLKTVSAFANFKGGIIFFGIDDNDNVVGLKDYKKDSENITNIIKTKMDSVPDFDIHIQSENSKTIIILYVYKGSNPPYFVLDNKSFYSYKRVGNQTISLTKNDIQMLSVKSLFVSFDAKPTKIKISDVTFKELINEYKKRTLKDFEEKDFVSFGLASKNGNLTVAGVLFADKCNMFRSRVFCTRWNGLTKYNGLMDALDDQEFEGGLTYLLNASMDFIKRNTKKMWKKISTHRIEYPEYPERAIQEVLVNALIHRDYNNLHSEIHIDIFDDRMEIYSPGGMFDGTIIQNIEPSNIFSLRRNPILADLFWRMNLMERRGSGISKVINSYEIQENYVDEYKPIFKSTETFFYVILKNLNYPIYEKTDNNLITHKNNTYDTQNDYNVTQKSQSNNEMSPKNDAYDTQNDYNVTRKSQSNNRMSPKNDAYDTQNDYNVTRNSQSNNEMSPENDAYDTKNDYNVTLNSQSNNEMSLKNDTCDAEKKHNSKQFNTVKKLNRKEKILNLIRNNSNLTSKQLSDYFSLSLRTVKRDLKEMVDENLIEYIGSSKKGFWKIK